jgi:putative DNA primase/helicase
MEGVVKKMGLPEYTGISFDPDPTVKSAAAKVCLSGEHYVAFCELKGRPLRRIRGIPMYWAGTHWESIDDRELEWVGRTVPMVDWRTRDLVTDALLKEFRASVLRCLPVVEIQKSSSIKVNFRNGTLWIDANTGERVLKPHSKDDYLMNCLPYDYDPEATAPVYERVLSEWLPDEEERERLHQVVACAFIQKEVRRMEVSLYLFGSGGTGKTTHLNHLANVFGRSNTSYVGMRELTSQITGVFSAVGKLINIDDEAPAVLTGNRFKALVSRSVLEFKQLYKEPIATDAIPMLWMASNHRINFGDYSDAVYRRIEVFEYKNKPTTVNKNLDNELETELAGTMNIILEALSRLIRNNYVIGQTKESKAQLEMQERDTDHVAQFLEDITAKKVDFSYNKQYMIPGVMLREAYATWCRINGYKPLANQHYSQSLRKHGYESIRTMVNGIQKTIWNMTVEDPSYLGGRLLGGMEINVLPVDRKSAATLLH